MIQDAESVRSGHSHVTSQPVSFPPHPIPGRMPSRSVGMPSRRDGPPRIWDTHGKSGNVFAGPAVSSTAPYPQALNPWISDVSEHTSPHVMSESQTPVQDQRCQSGPSAKNSVIASEGDSSKNYGADQQRLQISDLHFDKFPTPATFACWKIRFKTEECTCSQFPTEAMHWIKEVEMVDSVDELKSSSSIRGIPMPNFEVLDAKIASALNRIIHSSHFKRRVSLDEQKTQKEDRFLRRRQIAYLIYEYFRVAGANDSVQNCADLFSLALRNDDVQEFGSKWDGILLSITKIPPDDILRESEKLKTVLELYNMEIHQKKAGPDYHRLKTMVKRSIEQDLRNRNLAPETEIMKETPWSRIRRQNSVDKELFEIVGNKKPTGSALKETIVVSVMMSINVQKWHSRIRLRILSCSRVKEKHRETEVAEEKSPAVECVDGHARITSKELAPLHSVKSGTLQNACSTRPRVVCRIGEKCSYAHRQVDEQPSKKVQKECWQKCSGYVEKEWAAPKNRETCFGRLLIMYTTIGLRIPGCGAAEVYFTEELRHTETDPMCKIHESRCTSRRHSRPKLFARNDLPRRTSSS